MRASFFRLPALIVLSLLSAHAYADDWNVVRLRGTVVQLVGGEWQPLSRGSIVPDDRMVRTMGNGHATLTRGKETIELSANTQIQIFDKGGNKPFTTVVEHFGTVAIEAEVRDVQHFAVTNQYLAAVVKGTRFVVSAGQSGGTVEVQRGHVEVDSVADETTTILAVGQAANVLKTGALTVSGKGKLPAVVKKADKAAKAKPKVASASGDKKGGEALSPSVPPSAASDDLDPVVPSPGVVPTLPKPPEHDKPGKPDDKPGKSDDKPGKPGKPDDKPGKPGEKPPKGDDKPGKGADDNSGKGHDDHSGKGHDKPAGDDKPGQGHDKPKGDDKSGKGPGDNSGKGGRDDDKSGKGKARPH